MKTQNEIRGEFEKLEFIANLIQKGGAFYCDKGDWYLCQSIDHSAIEMALDMAWYAFQEQQKKIDLFDKMILGLRNEFNLWVDDTESFNAIEAQIENIEELLK